MVVRRYIDFLILLIPIYIYTALVFVLFCSSMPTYCSFFKMFFVLVLIIASEASFLVRSMARIFSLYIAINIIIYIYICEKSELSGLFNGTDFLCLSLSLSIYMYIILYICVTLRGRIKGTARALYCINPC